MSTEELEQLKFPIGEFIKPEIISEKHLNDWIATIEAFPSTLKSITDNLAIEELNYRYRPEGWTIKQVVHHCADSHMNSIIRFKLALTEDTPTIRPYFENRWANLIDSNDNDIKNSLNILIGVHAKLSQLLKTLSINDLKREFIHPEHGKRFSLEETIGVYAWHSDHHLAHIKQALNFKDTFK